MRLPVIYNRGKYKKDIAYFLGLNRTENFKAGELARCYGVSHEAFPYLTERRKLRKIENTEGLKAIIHEKHKCEIKENALYVDDEKKGNVKSGKKKLLMMGNFVLIFPDKAYYNIKTKKFGYLYEKLSLEGIDVTFESDRITVPENLYDVKKTDKIWECSDETEFYCFKSVEINGGSLNFSTPLKKTISELKEGDIIKNNCAQNEYMLFKSAEKIEGYKAYKTECTLVSLLDRVKNIFDNFSQGDVIRIKGCNEKSNNKQALITSKENNKLIFPPSSFTPGAGNLNITLEREIPDFTDVTVYSNRLFGCFENTIYSSKLGDPKNFYSYQGLSTDSFTIESNSKGDFTACIPYGTSCLFFKENAIFKLYGTRPSNFQLIESSGYGIEKTSRDSLCTMSDRIFYLAPDGVYSYFGGTPVKISEKLGKCVLKDGVAVLDDRNYFLSAVEKGERKLFVYDIEKRLWSIWGNTDAFGFSFCNSRPYMLCTDGMYEITDEADDECHWSIELNPFDENHFRTKNYTRLSLCVVLEENAYVELSVKENNLPYKKVSVVKKPGRQYISVPLILRSASYMTIRLSGKGKSVIENMRYEFIAN